MGVLFKKIMHRGGGEGNEETFNMHLQGGGGVHFIYFFKCAKLWAEQIFSSPSTF